MSIGSKVFSRFLFTVVALLASGLCALAHVTVLPKESAAGASQKYTMRVPTERDSATVSVEVQFPATAGISSVDQKAGWKVEQKKDASGKVVGAVWSGSAIAPRQVGEFTFEAQNPPEDTSLIWKVVQVYADGSRSEWTGAQDSRTPAPVTLVKKAVGRP